MPGPGGGSRGGGFGGGSFGGPRPGGFGGPHHHHRPNHHFGFFPFFGFRRPFYGYGYGGGCLGGLMGLTIMPIIIILVAISLLFNVFGSVGSSISNIASGGKILYNERNLQNYADQQYAVEFKNANDYEDNILIVFLVDEECEGYYTIAWVGDNIAKDIYSMFGNEYTEFGYNMIGNINSYYENSLSKNLASVIDGMTDEVSNLKLKSSFDIDNGSPAGYKSHVTNHSTLEVNEDTINRALEDFTAQTDIPIVIAIDDVDDVFDKRVQGSDVLVVVLAIALGGVAVYLIYKSFKGKKDGDNGQTEEERRNNSTSW